MSTIFKNVWRCFTKQNPIMDLQTLDLLISDVTERMVYSRDVEEWRNLYHERDALRIQRNMLTQYV